MGFFFGKEGLGGAIRKTAKYYQDRDIHELMVKRDATSDPEEKLKLQHEIDRKKYLKSLMG